MKERAREYFEKTILFEILKPADRKLMLEYLMMFAKQEVEKAVSELRQELKDLQQVHELCEELSRDRLEEVERLKNDGLATMMQIEELEDEIQASEQTNKELREGIEKEIKRRGVDYFTKHNLQSLLK